MKPTKNRFTAYQEQITEQQQLKAATVQIDEALYNYFSLRRRHLIHEIRMLDRLLGFEQTIPERVR